MTMENEVPLDMTPSNYVVGDYEQSDLARLFRMKKAIDVVHEFFEWLCHDHRRTVIHKDFRQELHNVMTTVTAIMGHNSKSVLCDMFMFSALRGIRDGLKDQEKRFPFNLEEVEREVIDPSKAIIALQELPIQEQAAWCGIWYTTKEKLSDYQIQAINAARTEGAVSACDDSFVLSDDIEMMAAKFTADEWSDMSEAERGKVVLEAIQALYVFEML